jgi:hypothetical protein
MKTRIKIKEDGHLQLARKGQLADVHCPFSVEASTAGQQHGVNNGVNHYIQRSCGDWCPMFQDPEITDRYEHGGKSKETTIKLCQTEHSCPTEAFDDVRKV